MVRKVVKIENYIGQNARGSKGSNYLTLECGHVKRQKGSIRIPEYCNCQECTDLPPDQATAAQIEDSGDSRPVADARR